MRDLLRIMILYEVKGEQKTEISYTINFVINYGTNNNAFNLIERALKIYSVARLTFRIMNFHKCP